MIYQSVLMLPRLTKQLQFVLLKVQGAKHDLALFPGTDSKGGLVLTTCIIMHIPYNREYNDQSFYLELVAPMGRSIQGVNLFME